MIVLRGRVLLVGEDGRSKRCSRRVDAGGDVVESRDDGRGGAEVDSCRERVLSYPMRPPPPANLGTAMRLIAAMGSGA